MTSSGSMGSSARSSRVQTPFRWAQKFPSVQTYRKFSQLSAVSTAYTVISTQPAAISSVW